MDEWPMDGWRDRWRTDKMRTEDGLTTGLRELDTQFQTYLSCAVDSTGEVVHFLVTLVSPPVLEQVLDSRHQKHQDDGDHRDLLPKSVDRRNPVEKDDEEEVKVGEAMELLKQVLRYKAEKGVLGGTDSVAEIGCVGMVFCRRRSRYVVVGGDLPVLPGSLLLGVLARALIPLPKENLLFVVGRSLS